MILSGLLSEIEARAEKAESGPWTWRPVKGNHAGVLIFGPRFKWSIARVSGVGLPTYEFIATSRTDVPRLVKALRVATDCMKHLPHSWGAAVDLARIEAILKGEGE